MSASNPQYIISTRKHSKYSWILNDDVGRAHVPRHIADALHQEDALALDNLVETDVC
jgi:hypothetical protein